MFLWLTSPAASAYVSPPDVSGNRTLLAHSRGIIRPFPLRISKLRPHRLPTAIDRSGHLIEVKPADPGAKPLVRDPSGKVIEIVHARLENKRVVLLDAEGKVIQAQHVSTLTTPPERRTSTELVAREFCHQNTSSATNPTTEISHVFGGLAPHF
jgi:hypothetical protein